MDQIVKKSDKDLCVGILIGNDFGEVGQKSIVWKFYHIRCKVWEF